MRGAHDCALPRIPPQGAAARIGSEVLLSTLVGDGRAPGFGGGLGRKLREAGDPAHSAALHCAATPSVGSSAPPHVGAVRSVLFQKDHLAAVKVPSSWLLGADPAAQRERLGNLGFGSFAAPPTAADASDPGDAEVWSQFLSAELPSTASMSSMPIGVVSVSGGSPRAVGPPPGTASDVPPVSDDARRGQRRRGQAARGVATSRSSIPGMSSSRGSLALSSAADSLGRDELRTSHLQECFAISRKEIEARLASMEGQLRHQGRSPAKMLNRLPTGLFEHRGQALTPNMSLRSEDEAAAASITRAAFAKLGVSRASTGRDSSSRSTPLPGPKDKRDMLTHEFQLLLEAAKHANLSKVVPTAQPTNSASKEEVIYTCELLNFIRWLCGLPEVKLSKMCTNALDLLNQAMLPRPEVALPPMGQQFGNISLYARHLSEFMSFPGRCIVLHRETSIIHGVAYCILGATVEEAIARAPEPEGQVSLDSILERAERHRETLPAAEPDPWSNTKPILSLALMDRRHMTSADLPPHLSDLQVLWLLAERGEAAAAAQHGPPGAAGGASAAARVCTAPDRSARPPPASAPMTARPSTTATSRSAASVPSAAARPRLAPLLVPPGSARGGQRRRWAAQGRTLKLEWGEDAPQREKDKARACTLCWGDRADVATYRRYLLSPALRDFGASRMQDTCALWSGEDPGYVRRPCVADGDGGVGGEAAVGEESGAGPDLSNSLGSSWGRESEQAAEPEIVCFPPPGIFPHELLLGTVPVWTMMPNCQVYQPTEQLMVRMWRVRIVSPESPGGFAQRCEEIELESLSVDCSTKGNPFCILFRPALNFVNDGDQFEVEISGLRGHQTTRHFFHEFTSFQANRKDHHLVLVAKDIRDFLDDPVLWRAVQETEGGRTQQLRKGGSSATLLSTMAGSMLNGKSGPTSASHAMEAIASTKANTAPGEDSGRSLPRSRPKALLEAAAAAAAENASGEAARNEQCVELGLVSHPNKTIVTELVDVTISLRSPGAAAIRAGLNLIRVSGNEAIKNATLVMRIRDYFIIRVKLPMAPAKYELNFWVAPKSAPETLVVHPLRYHIVTTENCQNLMVSVDHPLKHKFGYTWQPPASQPLGVCVLSPMMQRVCTGYAYFLIYFDPSVQESAEEAAEAAAALKAGEHLQAWRARLRRDRAEPQLGQHSELFRERLHASERQAAMAPGAEDPGGLQRTVSSDDEDAEGGRDHHGLAGGPEKSSTSSLRSTRRLKKELEEEKPVGAMSAMFTTLAQQLQHVVKDCRGPAHLDVSLVEVDQRAKARSVRYVLRLNKRSDFRNFHDGLLHLGDVDVGHRVEIHLQFPRVQAFPPLKVGEWTVIKKEEHFPIGF